MRILFVAHPDDDIIFFGNLELFSFFDLKIIMTCTPSSGRAAESIRWTKYSNPGCKVVLLGNKDYDFQNQLELINQLKPYFKNGDIVFTHGPNGEYGHIQHKLCHDAVVKGFSHLDLTIFAPHYPIDLTERHISGSKDKFLKEFFPSQYLAVSNRFGLNLVHEQFDKLR